MNEFLQLAKLSKKGFFDFVLACVQNPKRYLECGFRTVMKCPKLGKVKFFMR